ncbi:MAG TPA: response regulator transcription factor [Acidimicrobiia bacterium]|nr:response regulator transcription factor [Acidimicrobiia bacterium]
MGRYRKHVTICTEDKTFASAVRIVLDGYDSTLVQHPGSVELDTDLLVYRVDDDPPYDLLSKLASEIPTLVLGSEEQLVPAVDSNCRGFLLDSAPLDDVRKAVDTIVAGGAVVPPELLGALLRHVVQRRRSSVAAPGLENLTDREREVFRLAAGGARKEEIGQRLFISPATARTHLQKVYRKLGVHSQAELIALASHARGREEET